MLGIAAGELPGPSEFIFFRPRGTDNGRCGQSRWLVWPRQLVRVHAMGRAGPWLTL